MPRDSQNCRWCHGRGCVYCPPLEDRAREGLASFVRALGALSEGTAKRTLREMIRDQKLEIFGMQTTHQHGRELLAVFLVPGPGWETDPDAPGATREPASEPARELSPALRSLFCAHENARRTSGPNLEKRCLQCGSVLQLRWNDGRRDWVVTHNPHVLDEPTIDPKPSRPPRKPNLKPANLPPEP